MIPFGECWVRLVIWIINNGNRYVLYIVCMYTYQDNDDCSAWMCSGIAFEAHIIAREHTPSHTLHIVLDGGTCRDGVIEMEWWWGRDLMLSMQFAELCFYSPLHLLVFIVCGHSVVLIGLPLTVYQVGRRDRSQLMGIADSVFNPLFNTN